MIFINFSQIVMIGWGHGHKARLHDHPIGGCLAKVVEGHGIYETHYLRLKTTYKPSLNPTKFDFLYPTLYKKDDKDRYYCVEETNSDGCTIKNETTAWMHKLGEYHMTKCNLQVTYIEGYDYMHSVFNPHKDTTLTLHHYFGDYHISFWKSFSELE